MLPVRQRSGSRANEKPLRVTDAPVAKQAKHPILNRDTETRHTGRPGYPIRVLWRCLVASYCLGIVHDTDLVQRLEANRALAEACGITSFEAIPSIYAICRFRRKLASFHDAVAQVLSDAVETVRSQIPDFGATVAVDATDIKAWANGFHQWTDPDAGTGAKQKAARRVFWYGYKVHLAVDANSELPLWFEVTPANRYDGDSLPSVLDAARSRFDWFKPRYVLADKGYDASRLFKYVGEELKAIPIIDVRKQRNAEPRETLPCEAYPVETPEGIRYRCDRRVRTMEAKCPVFTLCPAFRTFVDDPVNWERHPGPVHEQYAPFPYRSTEWTLLYNKRVSVERAFSRLKGYRKLNSLRTRRMPKVWLHVAMGLLVTLASRGSPTHGHRAENQQTAQSHAA